jgi:cell division protein FtsQ
LRENSFWNAQIEQINVLKDNDIELIPRVGDHIIYLGKIDNFEEKLKRLMIFYKDGLNKIGWNKYKRINLEYDNQIICTNKHLKGK